jgi:hypothetical protein
MPESTEGTVTGRSAALAASFEDAITGVAALVEGCSDAEWQQVCTGEQWSVAVTAHHIAASTSPLMDFIGLVADGQPLPPITLDMIHDGNANHAQAFAQCTREETLVLLRDDGARVADRVVRSPTSSSTVRPRSPCSAAPRPVRRR